MENFRDEYNKAIDLITSAASRMSSIVDSEDSDRFHDVEEPFIKVNPKAFCLKLAYRIWMDVKAQMTPPPIQNASIRLYNPITKMMMHIMQDDEAPPETAPAKANAAEEQEPAKPVTEEEAAAAINTIRAMIKEGVPYEKIEAAVKD